MTFSKLRAEYERDRIGEQMYERIGRIVRRTAAKYPPSVYSELATTHGDWSDDAIEALVQSFVTESLLADGQLDYTMSQAACLADFDRLTGFQLRRHLRKTRRRSVIDNLIDRVRDLLGSDPYQVAADGKSWYLDDRSVEDREPRRTELEDAVRSASVVPREVSHALERGPRIYAPDDLATLVRVATEALVCPISLDHFRWIFEQLLTELVPSDLLPIYEEPPEGEDTTDYGIWVEAHVRSESDSGGDLMAMPAPPPDEAALVNEGVRQLRASLDEQQVEILRLKLAGTRDEDVAAAVSLSRPTVAARKQAIYQRVAEQFAGLDERWRRHALDELARSLSES